MTGKSLTCHLKSTIFGRQVWRSPCGSTKIWIIPPSHDQLPSSLEAEIHAACKFGEELERMGIRVTFTDARRREGIGITVCDLDGFQICDLEPAELIEVISQRDWDLALWALSLH